MVRQSYVGAVWVKDLFILANMFDSVERNLPQCFGQLAAGLPLHGPPLLPPRSSSMLAAVVLLSPSLGEALESRACYLIHFHAMSQGLLNVSLRLTRLQVSSLFRSPPMLLLSYVHPDS